MESVFPSPVTCCTVGGGPPGMMLGYLSARAGIEVLVLEKHADFLRDFRGDTVHPSTLEAMHELGVLDDFLKRPHQKQVRQIRARIGRDEIMLGDLSRLSTHCRFMAMMPQWEFLDFLAEQARRHSTFHLRMETEVTGLIEEKGRIVGIRGNAPTGPVEVCADLVVGADGRNVPAKAMHSRNPRRSMLSLRYLRSISFFTRLLREGRESCGDCRRTGTLALDSAF